MAKRQRRPSPPLKPDRAGNRERPPARKKLAIVAELQQRTNEIMARARETASKYAAPDRETWFTRFAAKHPDLAADLTQVVVDWLQDGEMRQSYPTLSHLHRFVDHEVTRVERQAFAKWLAKIEASL
jgi:GTP1/Obg family GTP-binding protein